MGEQIHVGGASETDVLAQKAGITANSHVLDVCSALGGPARYLARKYGCRVTGLDATPRMYEEAIRRTEEAGLSGKIDYKLGNAVDMPFRANTFDVVWGQDAWCYVTDKERLIRECARVVKAGGVVAFTDWLETGPMTDEEWMALHMFMVFPYVETLDGYAALAEAAGFEPHIYRWDPAERAELMAELDAAFFLLYGVRREDTEYILSTFSGVRKERNGTFDGSSTFDRIMRQYDHLTGKCR